MCASLVLAKPLVVLNALGKIWKVHLEFSAFLSGPIYVLPSGTARPEAQNCLLHKELAVGEKNVLYFPHNSCLSSCLSASVFSVICLLTLSLTFCPRS